MLYYLALSITAVFILVYIIIIAATFYHLKKFDFKKEADTLITLLMAITSAVLIILIVFVFIKIPWNELSDSFYNSNFFPKLK